MNGTAAVAGAGARPAALWMLWSADGRHDVQHPSVAEVQLERQRIAAGQRAPESRQHQVLGALRQDQRVSRRDDLPGKRVPL